MTHSRKTEAKPDYVAKLEAAYGAPSQAGFGSAVFYEPSVAAGKLEQAALAKYQYFAGELWERWGADAWMGPWKEVYARQAGDTPDIVQELGGGAGVFDLTLTLPEGAILGMIGPSGCGKTTTVRLLNGIYGPTAGEVRVFDKNLLKFKNADKARIG